MCRVVLWGIILPFVCAPAAQADENVDELTFLQSYYKHIDGEQKQTLKTAVKGVVANHEVLSYSSLWSYYYDIDVVPGTTNQVFDYYSPKVYYYSAKGSAPSGANKEHACPQSWWGGGSSSNSYSDLFNVMPSESVANSAKGNFPVGVVGTVKYSNGRIKVGSAQRGSKYQGDVFEPADEHKGDFARLYFYVATVYSASAWGSKSSASGTCAFRKEDYPTIKSDFVQLLLDWNRMDPVDDWEIGRNERVYAVQHNRNPFIDYPQLAEYIWGDSTTYVFDLSTAVPHCGLSANGGGSGTGGAGQGNDDFGNGGTSADGKDSTIVTPIGEPFFADDFFDIKEGGHTSSGSSSALWLGNDNFPDVATAYQAGGAVRLGSSSKAGSMTSHIINFEGGDVVVEVDVKGWTTVEGALKVSMSGSATQTASYKAVMSGAFETVRVSLTGVTAHPKLTLQTSTKRCFVDAVRVYKSDNTIDITSVAEVDVTPIVYDLLGNRVGQIVHPGIYIVNGKKRFVTLH